MAGPFLAVLGDSVAWGQGLTAGNKASVRVAAALAAARFPGMAADTWAHSGAVIGWSAQCDNPQADGEVPDACQSIRQQVERYDKAPADVPVVWLNGGINDVDIRVILNPLTRSKDLSDDIRHYCLDHMLNLLRLAQTKFTQSTIVVTPYFPVLSSKSDPLHIPRLLETLAIGIPGVLPLEVVINKIISLSLQFWHESTGRLKEAVAQAGGRVRFADVPFTEDNSVFGPQPWLFGLNPDLGAQDEMAGIRRAACIAAHPLDLLAREQCFRASAGHPNFTGEMKIADAILSVV